MARILNISLIIIFLVVILFSLGMSQNETLSITTYYPSPVGTYRELRWGQSATTSRGRLIADPAFGSSIELGGIGQPFIAFANDMAAYPAFDARIILRRDDALDIEGAELNIGTVLSFSNNPPPMVSDASIILRTDDALEIEGANLGVGIIPNPAYKLDVAGNINCTGDVYKNGSLYTNPDYVFEPGYSLLPLREVGKFVTEKRHLPNMPSSEEVKKNGVKLFEQNRLMLEKLEEAYLYIVELENRVAKLEAKSGPGTKK